MGVLLVLVLHAFSCSTTDKLSSFLLGTRQD
jgi:hypothetical protein